MLRKLRIQNFKGWEDTGAIRIAPITLFFGANSSGKSSIGQFLMMLKQTVESQDRKAVFEPGDRNAAVQLGSYQEMVFHREPERNIEFEYTWDLKDTLKLKDAQSGRSYTGDKLTFGAKVGLVDKSLQVANLEYLLIDNADNNILSVGMDRKAEAKSEYKVEADKYTLKRNPGRVWLPGAPVRFYGFPDEVVAYYQNADFVQELNLRHENLFKSIFYLGPLRTKAERLYYWRGIEPESVGNSGENTIAAILAARKRLFNYTKKGRTSSFEQIIASHLKEMDLIEDFEVNSIAEKRQEYEVKLRTKGSESWVDLPDVGFGISQVLPVLVQLFYAPKDSIIIMEQPEIHLHPSAQSALADVMIAAIKSRENNLDRNIQLIIETHSEHFLRRLQRRIAENKVSSEKVSSYFADVSSTPAQLEPLKIDMFGYIENWPKNFFGDEMGDITAQADAAMKKRISQKQSEGTNK